METVIVELAREPAAADVPPPFAGHHDPPLPGRQLVGVGVCACPGLDLVLLRSRFVSLDGTRVLSVFAAPDAEIVRRGMRFLALPGYKTVAIWTAQR